jgi:hypothetical protein
MKKGASDFPASIFYKELIQAYPSATLILSLRPEDSWYKSMLDTLWHGYSNASPSQKSSEMGRMAALYHMHIWKNDFPTFGREAYTNHNDGVRRESREAGREWLEFDVSQGWAPLCKFLGKSIPEGVAFPRADDWAEYKARVKREEENGLESKKG